MKLAKIFGMYRLGMIILIVAGISGCEYFNTPGSNITPIGEIKPETREKNTVYIQGKVNRRVPLVKRWAYEIEDSTGKIWVVSSQRHLKPDQLVVINGKVLHKSIILGGQELGEQYLEEK